MKGFKELDDLSEKQFNKVFMELSRKDKLLFIRNFHDKALAMPHEKRMESFIMELKEMTLLGFFTSEAGATQVHRYNAVPGSFRGCVPLTEIGRARATE